MTEKPTILVVDDDPGMQETVRMVLGPEYKYAFASNTYQAELVFQKMELDLVLLDLNLPGASGLDLLPILRKVQPEAQVIIITAFGTYDAALKAIRHKVASFLEKDFTPSELRAVVEKTIQQNIQAKVMNQVLDSMRETHGTVPETLTRLAKSGTQDEHSLLKFFRLLADVLESQDYVTAGHSLRVSRFGSVVGRQMGLSEAQVHDLELSAYLHDIGKVGLNKSILNKEGSFSRLERLQVQQHPEIGAALLQPLGFGTEVIDAVRHHHERLDGSGYPDGISGADLGFFARLLGVVDSFDAMTSPRLYRMTPRAPLDALAILKDESPIKYDVQIVGSLEDVLEKGLIEVGTDPIRKGRQSRFLQLDPAFPELHQYSCYDSSAGTGPLPATKEAGATTIPVSQGTKKMDHKQTQSRERATAGIHGSMLGHAHKTFQTPSWTWLPLSELYADPESPERSSQEALVVHKRADGLAAYFDPVEKISKPLVPDTWPSFRSIVQKRKLRPFFAIPDTLTFNPALHLPPHGKAADVPKYQAFTDGRHVYVAEVTRKEGEQFLRYSLKAGTIKKEVERVELQEDQIAVQAATNDIVQRAARWLADPSNKETLAGLKKLLDEPAFKKDFHRTPYCYRFHTHLPWVEFRPLSPRQIDMMERRYPGAGPLLAVLRDHNQQLEPGAVKVVFKFVPTWTERTQPLNEYTLELEALPVYSKSMAQAIDLLLGSGSSQKHAGGGHAPARPLHQRLAAMCRLQTNLWRFGHTFEALLMARWIDSESQEANEGDLQDLALNLRFEDLPLLVPAARQLVTQLLDATGPELKLADAFTTPLPPAQSAERFRAIKPACEATGSPALARALEYIAHCASVEPAHLHELPLSQQRGILRAWSAALERYPLPNMSTLENLFPVDSATAPPILSTADSANMDLTSPLTILDRMAGTGPTGRLRALQNVENTLASETSPYHRKALQLFRQVAISLWKDNIWVALSRTDRGFQFQQVKCSRTLMPGWRNAMSAWEASFQKPKTSTLAAGRPGSFTHPPEVLPPQPRQFHPQMGFNGQLNNFDNRFDTRHPLLAGASVAGRPRKQEKPTHEPLNYRIISFEPSRVVLQRHSSPGAAGVFARVFIELEDHGTRLHMTHQWEGESMEHLLEAIVRPPGNGEKSQVVASKLQGTCMPITLEIHAPPAGSYT